ncbi:MAG: STT3 domain-containing protein [Desulfurococcaceae archaeon]
MNIARALKKLESHVGWIIYNFASKPKILKVFTALVVIVSLIFGVAIRSSSYRLNEFEFYELDSYVEYWQAKYVYEHGPLSWYTLTPENPSTHVFWYPWGRDFLRTSYPLLPMWTGLSFHIASSLGFSLKEWASIQPILFSVIATILACLAAIEISESYVAGALASIFYAILPAAVERSVLGYVEKEGVAAVFLFLFLFFYAKNLKSISKHLKASHWVRYTILSAWSLSMIGWLWGGYVFILGTVVAFSVMSPILVRRYLSKDFALSNVLLVIFSFIFVLPSPSTASSLGLYPISLRGLGWILLAGTLLPLLFYYLNVEYRKLGFKKPVLTMGVYAVALIALATIGALLSVYGILPIGGRLAWALGLRFVEVQPLVESIAEHQSPLTNIYTVLGMLRSWGVYWEPLLFASPLFMSIIGTLYLLYKGTPEKVYLSVAFAVAFYSYLNAVYMIGAASYLGVIVAASMVAIMISYVVPRISPVKLGKKKERIKSPHTTINPYIRVALLLLLVAILANTVYAGYSELQSNSRVIYTLRAGLSDLSLYYTSSWYKAIDAMKSTPNGSVIIAWWDYGYGISVAGNRVSVADGSTLNNTQIGIIGLIMLSNSTRQAAELAGLFKARANETFLMVIEGVFISEQNDSLVIWPVLTGRVLPGLVDWPKSLWMIRIGNSVVDELRGKGVNIDYISTEKFLYLYNIGQGVISPRYDQPERMPLIYRLIVDAVLYWAEENNKNGIFEWFTGEEQILSESDVRNVYSYLRINISRRVQVTDVVGISERPLVNDTYLEPFAVVVEPFIDPETKEPFTTTYMGYRGRVYSVIILYKFREIPT